MLREGPTAHRRLFETLFEQLRDGAAVRPAVDRAFDDADWKALDRDLRDCVEKLRRRA